MLWLRPFMLYQDCPEGDSFESSPDTPLIPIDTNLASTSRSTAPTASSSNVANGTGASSFHQPPRESFLQPPRLSGSSSVNNEGKKVKKEPRKERTSLPFFNARKMKERTGAFPLLQQSKNQNPKHIEKVLVLIVTPIKMKASKSSKILETKENIDPHDDTARPDPPAKTPPGKSPAGAPSTTKHLFQEAMLWNDDEDMPSMFPDISWNFAEPTSTTSAAGAGLSVSFPDFAAFFHGMEKNSSMNVADALNTTGFSSFCFANPEESIKEEKRDVDSNQEDKIADVPSKEDKPADDSVREDNPSDDSDKANKPKIDSNNGEKHVVDLKKPDALDQLVAAAATTEKALVAVATEIAFMIPVSFDSKTPEKPNHTLVESPDLKMHAKIKNVPTLTPVTEAESNFHGASDDEVIGGRDSPSDSSSSQSCINESNEERESHNYYHEDIHERSNLSSTDAVNEDDFVDEAYNSVNVSVFSLTEIFQDDSASEISTLTPVLGTAIAETSIEELGPIYSLGTSFESTVSKASTQHNRSMMGDWAAEVMSIEVSLEAGTFTLRKMDGPGQDTCVALQGHFMSRTEYLPRLTAQYKLALVEGPQDEIDADKESADYYVKAQWNEFLPATIFSSNCHQGEAFSSDDFCSGKKWVIRG